MLFSSVLSLNNRAVKPTCTVVRADFITKFGRGWKVRKKSNIYYLVSGMLVVTRGIGSLFESSLAWISFFCSVVLVIGRADEVKKIASKFSFVYDSQFAERESSANVVSESWPNFANSVPTWSTIPMC